jgi:F0F1-type ATP synthase membrane subunit b/b'
VNIDLNPLSPGQLNLVTMAVVAVVFLATYFGLRRFFVLPVLAVMRERGGMVEAARADQDEAARLLESANSDAEAMLAESRATADTMLGEAKEESLEAKREQIAGATRQASERLEAGRADIAKARKRAMAMMRSQAIECVGIACGQLQVESEDSSITEAVDKLLTRYAQ